MEKPESSSRPQTLALIESRIQKLQNRRFLLLTMQQLTNKTVEKEETDGTTVEKTSESSSELESILEELEKLQLKKEKLDKHGLVSMRSTAYKPVTPCGGIFILPNPQLEQEDIIQGDSAETPTGPVVPVNSLGPNPGVIKCPSCQEVISTKTTHKAGQVTWILCFLCSMMGCVAGCCLIPFFLDCSRNVQHHCPRCEERIHTHKPI